MNHSDDIKKPTANPYLAGVFLGLTLLLSFAVLGAGLGASGGIARLAASFEGAFAARHTLASEYFGGWGAQPLNYYLVFMFVGTVLGGMLSALQGGRVEFKLERGMASPPSLRAVLALTGGVLVGFASRLAQGCTSGQALTGGAMLLTGSLVFLVTLFAGGYAAAYFVRRQWHD